MVVAVNEHASYRGVSSRRIYICMYVLTFWAALAQVFVCSCIWKQIQKRSAVNKRKKKKGKGYPTSITYLFHCTTSETIVWAKLRETKVSIYFAQWGSMVFSQGLHLKQLLHFQALRKCNTVCASGCPCPLEYLLQSGFPLSTTSTCK